MLNEFIKYVREQFGYEITIEKDCKADTFESIFGDSLLKNDEDVKKEWEGRA